MMLAVKTGVQAIIDKAIKRRKPGSYSAYQFARRIVAAYENNDVNMTSNGERWLVRKLAQRGLKTAFDVGANRGEWAEAVLDYAPDARLLCFEPVPATFATLEAAITSPNVTLVNKALSSEPGTLTIHAVADNPHIASTYAGELFQPELARDAIEITATTGDNVIEEFGLSHVDIVKVDAEGHDFDVLQGMTKAIENGTIDIIQFEYNIFTLEADRSLHEFFRLLSPHYLVCRLLPDGLEACGYHACLENFGQSNWVAVRADTIDRDLINLLSIRRARGLPGDALEQQLQTATRLAGILPILAKR